jgi:hypothetical protein
LERTFDDNVDKRFSRDSRFRRNVDKRFSHDSRFRKDVGSEFDTKFNKKFRDFGVVRKFTNRFGAKFAKGEGKNRLTNSSLKRFK